MPEVTTQQVTHLREGAVFHPYSVRIVGVDLVDDMLITTFSDGGQNVSNVSALYPTGMVSTDNSSEKPITQ
jgi:hypothetical protein